MYIASKRSIALLSAILFSVLLNAQERNETLLLEHFHSISSEEIASWMKTLCSQEYNGRLAGTPEYVNSAEWVAEKLQEWGIKPAGDNGSYYQWFNHPYTVVNDIGSLSMHIDQNDGTAIVKSYKAPEDYYPGMNSGDGAITAEVVFVGYGVTAPELDYDDYKGIDVTGKIVLMNRDVPYKDAHNPEYSKWVKYCYHQYKVENAALHGAAGMLYIDGNSANPNITYIQKMIVTGIGPEPLEDIFAGLGKTNEGLLSQIDKSFKPSSFATGKVMTIRNNTTRYNEGRTCNVIGILPGSDSILKNEAIILGAHLDAVGNAGGLLVAGGLDNASGVVDIMAAAKALAQSGIKLKRSVLFLLFGAEETGLIGSKYFVDNSLFIADNTLAYFNLDMVGNGTGLAVRSSPECGSLLEYFSQMNERYIHRPMSTATSSGKYFGRPRSDGLVFLAAGYPVIDIHDTDRVKPVWYHLPGDNETAVTTEIMEDVAKLIFLTVVEIAGTE